MNTTALTDFFLFFVRYFCFLFFLLCPFLSFLKGMEKTTNWTQNNQRRNKTTRCKLEKHLVLLTKKGKQTTQTQNNATSLFRLQAANTKKQNKNIKSTLSFSQLNFKKYQKYREKCFPHRLKAKQETRQKHKKQEDYQTQIQHRNRKAETDTMKTTRINNQPKMKALWIWEGDVWKVCFKETCKH